MTPQPQSPHSLLSTLPTTEGHRNLSVAFYRPELDTLRFFAFLAVFMFHAACQPASYFAERGIPLTIARVLSRVTNAGSRGVDLFFVLSAYLITELLLQEKRKRGFLDVKAFYIRRILRIWPLYYAFVIAAAVIPFLNPWGKFSLRYVIPFMLLSGNWSTIVFGPTGSVAEPLWSVSVEEQFYLLWAPLVARLSRRGIYVAAGVMVMLANMSRMIEVMRHATGWQIWANTFTHLDAMAGGILLAVVLHGKMPRIVLWQRLVLIAIALMAIVLGSGSVERVSSAAILLGYPTIAFACTLLLTAVLGMSLQVPFLQYLGKISYGLYVYHLTCIMLASRLLPVRWGVAGMALRILLALVITGLIAAISYRFFEAPALRLKRRFAYVDSRPV